MENMSNEYRWEHHCVERFDALVSVFENGEKIIDNFHIDVVLDFTDRLTSCEHKGMNYGQFEWYGVPFDERDTLDSVKYALNDNLPEDSWFKFDNIRKACTHELLYEDMLEREIRKREIGRGR